MPPARAVSSAGHGATVGYDGMGSTFFVAVGQSDTERRIPRGTAMSTGLTANERYKRRFNRLCWVGTIAAAGLHVGVVLFLPPFEVTPFAERKHASRMLIAIGSWSHPTCQAECPRGYLKYSAAAAAPRLANASRLNYRLPRTYPWVLWDYQEPSDATVEIVIRRSGAVREARLLESSANGSDEAILELVRLMQFDMPELEAAARGMVARLEIVIAPPL
jgi:hypothetical protein